MGPQRRALNFSRHPSDEAPFFRDKRLARYAHGQGALLPQMFMEDFD